MITVKEMEIINESVELISSEYLCEESLDKEKEIAKELQREAKKHLNVIKFKGVKYSTQFKKFTVEWEVPSGYWNYVEKNVYSSERDLELFKKAEKEDTVFSKAVSNIDKKHKDYEFSIASSASGRNVVKLI